MSNAGLLVIGSGPAGVAAAEAYRARQADHAVRILTADTDPPYQRPPLSKDFLRGDTDDSAMEISRPFETILKAQVDEIDVGQRVVTASGLRYEYDRLIIASGASPQPLPVPGGEKALSLRSFDHATRLRDAATSAKTAVVIGAGFIGCEAAASLAIRGLSVTLIAPDEVPQRKRLGEDAGVRLRRLVEATGARFAGNARVASIGDGTVQLEDGTTVAADLVLAATGVKPNAALAESAGITLQNGRIPVGPDMRTAVDGVWAAGDVAFAVNVDAGRALAVEHWGDAMDQGEVAGSSAAGDEAKWTGVPGFWTTIGDTDVKYHAWGDGYQNSRLIERDGGFTVWYESDGAVVGVLTCNADDDYEAGEELITAGKPPPVDMSQ
ncbi:NAD(P)/FAD-dependent oxidoreductase [Mycolicibacterium iranicum]|uniref:FAD-dependent oxidoreductase n=1 Tax=Mycolicibacterium iranicum TaxID=912594 RepID=A0ABT4HIJ3_MYCIR|nr:FAD-dependent oxidoreductase [Mycolicibacterium iranicum]MCZ0730021.1 FAD-dependent oxidoreductase [Mycolicibacterium iranicum]